MKDQNTTEVNNGEIPENESTTTETTETSNFEKELADLKDTYTRLYADFDNYKKRSLKERSELIRFAGSDVVTSLLPVLDDFERALKSFGDEENTMKEGIQLIYSKLVNTLEQRGLKAIESIGTDFNVDFHEAVSNVPVEDESQKGKVIDELEKGYSMHDKVIRYAKVVVGN